MAASKWLALGKALFFLLVLPVSASSPFNSAISPCPIRCGDTGNDPATWTYYHDLSELDICKGTVLFQMNLYNAVDDEATHNYYRACTASGGTVIGSTPEIGTSGASDHTHSRRQVLSFNGSAPSTQELHWTTYNSAGSLGDVESAQSVVSELRTYIQQLSSTNTTAIFSRSDNVIGGLYLGSQVDRSSADEVIGAFHDRIGDSAPARVAAQVCDSVNHTIATQNFGLIVDGTNDVAAVQKALKTWDQADCVDGDADAVWRGTSLRASSGKEVSIKPSRRAVIAARDTCRYTQVQSGDGCYALAQRCGISQSDLESYNGGGDFCSTLKPDQYVCCSPGSEPDFTPQPNGDGSCFAYTVKENDNCADIATAHQMTVEDIQNRNSQTWGWQGCKNIFIGMKMCLSSGTPPFPSVVDNAVCGPQVKGTEPTSDPSGWTDLNPCPLNACCDIFGQCGVTKDFCTPDPADTGNPGTAQPGSNGCISNCGTDIVTGPPTGNFQRVGYYEAFGADRPCLHMSVDRIPKRYTTVHWAFADLTSDFQPSVSRYQDAWNTFVKQSGFKKIVSFGGWTFSTAPSTYDILREAVKPENRQAFADHVVSFVQNSQLDGVDFDWEYPGAPDNQGEAIPVDSPESAMYYLDFLKLLRSQLPSQYTMSIAIPASYYYLKAFPAKEMSQVLDYFIFMTYDLHGQWDYGNKFTSPGCPAGNCLRSHINRTETETAFSMITKAGVPINKLMMGSPLYGRSFKMSQAGCYTQDCTYTGPDSGATAGRCTGTPGYLSNYEIYEIIAGGGKRDAIEQHSSEEAGDILMYGDNNWVSWEKPETYKKRSDWAHSLGLAGTSDWAMDLNATDSDDDSTGGSGGDAENGNADDLCNEVQGSNLSTEDWRKNNFSCAPISYRKPGSGDRFDSYSEVLPQNVRGESGIQALWRQWAQGIGDRFSCAVIGDYSLSRAADGTECSPSILHDNADCGGSSLNDTAPVCLQAMYNWMEYFSEIVQTMETKYTDYVAGDLNKIEDRYGPADVHTCDTHPFQGTHDPIPSGLSAAFTILGGLFSISSAVKSLSAVGGIGSGVTGVISGAASITSDDDSKYKIMDQEFQDLQDLKSYLSKVVINGLVNGTATFVTNAANEFPDTEGQSPEDWAEKHHRALPWILSDGMFAESQAPAPVGSDDDAALTNFIKSTAVGWNLRRQKAFVLYALESDLGFDPCGEMEAKGSPLSVSSFWQNTGDDDIFLTCSSSTTTGMFVQQESDDGACQIGNSGSAIKSSFQDDFPNVSFGDLYIANASQQQLMNPPYNGDVVKFVDQTFDPMSTFDPISVLNFQLPVCTLKGDFPAFRGAEAACQADKQKRGISTCPPDRYYRYNYAFLRANCLCSGSNNPYPSWQAGKQYCRNAFDDSKGVLVDADAQLPPGSQ